MVPLWLAIVGLTWLAMEQHVDTAVIAGSVLVVGLVTNAFAWLLGIVALVPLIGPLIVKMLSIGFIWLLNAVGYLVVVRRHQARLFEGRADLPRPDDCGDHRHRHRLRTR